MAKKIKIGPNEVFTIEDKKHENSYHSNVINQYNSTGDDAKVAIELLSIARFL
jgi:hypothetical protein